MKRRDFLKAATATGASVALAGSGSRYAGSLESQKSQLGKQKPNVILIMTDDQGYGDLACHGNPSVKTPYLDRLYAESTHFTDFHVDPFCAPTRASLMTGRMSDRTHVRSTVYLRNHMNRDETTMAEFFKASGYRTAHFGKWHLGGNYPYRPMDRGFDQWVGSCDDGPGSANGYWGNDKMNDHYLRNGKWEKIDGFCADVFFDESMKFIGQKKDEPFFVYLATNIPHGPTAVLKEWQKPYENQDIPGGDPWGSTKDFYATITRFDKNLGRLRNYLAQNNLEDNTILIFLTDNGSAYGVHIFNAGMRGSKGALYEGGHRVPCFIHWPQGGLNQGVDVDRFTGHIDLLPTLVDICKLKTPARGHLDFDGRSLVALLNDKTSAWADRLMIKHAQNVMEIPVKGMASLAATERWRLIDRRELYDIKADPGQRNNIAAQHPRVVTDLAKKYDDYWDELQIEDRPYPRPIIGSGHDEETFLSSYDWIRDHEGTYTHNQESVLDGAQNSGFWPVEIAADGLYQFDIRRWPREINYPICAALPEQKTSDVFLWNKSIKLGKGKAIPVAKVRLDAGNRKLEKTISSSDVNAVFEMRLQAGHDLIRAWLIDTQGNDQGAYYVYVRRLS